MRVVVDTGVLFSALLKPDSVPAQAFELLLSRGTMLTSEDLLSECRAIFARPYLAQRVLLVQRLAVLDLLTSRSVLITPTSEVTDCRDPNDDYLLALALDGRADYLVTGDKDLLVLDPWRGVRIVDAATFLSLAAG